MCIGVRWWQEDVTLGLLLNGHVLGAGRRAMDGLVPCWSRSVVSGFGLDLGVDTAGGSWR